MLAAQPPRTTVARHGHARRRIMRAPLSSAGRQSTLAGRDGGRDPPGGRLRARADSGQENALPSQERACGRACRRIAWRRGAVEAGDRMSLQGDGGERPDGRRCGGCLVRDRRHRHAAVRAARCARLRRRGRIAGGVTVTAVRGRLHGSRRPRESAGAGELERDQGRNDQPAQDGAGTPHATSAPSACASSCRHRPDLYVRAGCRASAAAGRLSRAGRARRPRPIRSRRWRGRDGGAERGRSRRAPGG
jgi:hypothetical protein